MQSLELVSVYPLEVKPTDVLRRPFGGGAARAEQAETSYTLKTMQVTRSETQEEEDNLLKAIHQMITGLAWTLPL